MTLSKADSGWGPRAATKEKGPLQRCLCTKRQETGRKRRDLFLGGIKFSNRKLGFPLLAEVILGRFFSYRILRRDHQGDKADVDYR